jgi:hypothetical protein
VVRKLPLPSAPIKFLELVVGILLLSTAHILTMSKKFFNLYNPKYCSLKTWRHCYYEALLYK